MDEPTYPWEYQEVEGHDLIAIFKAAWHKADEAGAEGERTQAGLMAVFKVLGWELHDLSCAPDPLARRSAMSQHVYHRVGEQK